MSNRVFRRLAGDRRGTTALEFAIIAPVFLALVIGVVNFGYASYCGAAVRSAVQRASRQLIITPTTSAATLKTSALALLVDVPVENLTVTVSTETVSTSESIKRVSWTYDYLLWLPLLSDQTLDFNSSIVVPMAPTT